MQAFDQPFAERLTQVLYNEVSLRAPILRALKNIVQSSTTALQSLASPIDIEIEVDHISTPHASSLGTISAEDAQLNVSYLGTLQKSWLAVLFNVFASTERDSRSMVGDVIGVWASISSYLPSTQGTYLDNAYQNVLQHLRTSFEGVGAGAGSDVTVQMMDILLVLMPYLTLTQRQVVVSVVVYEGKVFEREDQASQKVGYRVVARAIEASGRDVLEGTDAATSGVKGLSDALVAATRNNATTLAAGGMKVSSTLLCVRDTRLRHTFRNGLSYSQNL